MSLETVLSSMKGTTPPLAAGVDLLAQQHTQEPERRSILNEAVHKVVGLAWHSESNTRNEVEGYASQFLTAVPLFIGGPRGMVASSVLFGLNQAKVGDTTTHQIEDFGLGALKGAGTKLAFDHFGAKKDWNFAAKGVAMGASSRGLDVALTRQTWFDQQGGFHPLTGAESTAMSMFHPAALATDVVTFGAAHYGIKYANVLSKGAIEASPLLQTSLTGTTFGFTSGALGEVQRQLTDPKEHFDPLKILARGGASAATMTLAGAAGFKLTDPAHLPVVQPQTERNATIDALKSKVSQVRSMLGGNDIGNTLGSGDVKGTDGELHRSIGTPDTTGRTGGGGEVVDPAGKAETTPPVEGLRAPAEFRADQEAVWRAKDSDQPIIVRRYLGEQGGKHYVLADSIVGRAADGSPIIEPGKSGIPLDEIAYKPADQTRVAETPAQRPEVKPEVGAADWIGTKYDNQQDSHWVSPDGKVAVVADGMGGHAAGEVASQIATDVFNRRYAEFPHNGTEQEQHNWLNESVRLADKAINQAAQSGSYVTVDGRTLNGEPRMATTVVASVQSGDKLLVSWAGDSRAYRLRDGKLEQLTEDHQDSEGRLTKWLGDHGLRVSGPFEGVRDSQGRLVETTDGRGWVRKFSYQGDTTAINQIRLGESTQTLQPDGRTWEWRSAVLSGTIEYAPTGEAKDIKIGNDSVFRMGDRYMTRSGGKLQEVQVGLDGSGKPQNVNINGVTWETGDGGKTWQGTSRSTDPIYLDQSSGQLSIDTASGTKSHTALNALTLGDTAWSTEDGGKTWTSNGQVGELRVDAKTAQLSVVDGTGKVIGSGPISEVQLGDTTLRSTDGNQSWDMPQGQRFGRFHYDPETQQLTFVRNLAPTEILPGDRLVLGTDGLEAFGPDRMRDALNKPSTASEAANNLIDAVKAYDDFGQDNVTAVVIDGPRAPEGTRSPERVTRAAGGDELKLKLPAGVTQEVMQNGVDLLARAVEAGSGSMAETEFFDYARRDGGKLEKQMQQVAEQLGLDEARELVRKAYTPDDVYSIPEGQEKAFQNGVELLRSLADEASPDNIRAFQQFVLGEGKDLGDVMVKAAEAIARTTGKNDVLARVENAYKPPTELTYDGRPELRQAFLQGYDLYKATQSPSHTGEDVQHLVDFARSPEGRELEPQMLAVARTLEGADGCQFMRDYVYHGDDAKISVGDTGEKVFVSPAKEEPTRQLIGLAEAASEPNSNQWYYEYLSTAARAADPEVRNAMLEYAEKSGNEALLITVRDALVEKSNVDIGMTADQAGRFKDFQTVVTNRPEMTAEGIAAYKEWVTRWLETNTDMHDIVRQMAPHIESSAAVDAIDKFFQTNNLQTFPVSRARLAEMQSADRMSETPTTTSTLRAADDFGAARPDVRSSVMSMPLDELLSQLHTAPDRISQEQAAVGAQARIAEMTDPQFVSFLEWLYQPGPDGRYNMNSIQFPNRSIMERPDVIASLMGETITANDPATNQPRDYKPTFSVEALRQYLTIPPEGVPTFPRWLEAFAQRQQVSGETLPNWLINDIKSRYIISSNPRLSPENPASAQVTPTVREQINADEAGQKARQAEPGAKQQKQRQAQAATSETIGNRLTSLATLLDANTPDAVERLMQLGAQDGRVLNDVVARLQRFGQVPELRELIRLILPNADNIYTMNIMLRSMEDASSMARKDAGRAQTAAQLAHAAADQMLPPDAAGQRKVSAIIDAMANGKYDVPRAPRKPFPGQEQKPQQPGRGNRPQAPQVPFFSNDAPPIEVRPADVADNNGAAADPGTESDTSLRRAANDAADDGNGRQSNRVPDVLNPEAPDGNARPKSAPRDFDPTRTGYDEVLAHMHDSPEDALAYSAYVSKYFEAVLGRNIALENLTIVVPEGAGSEPELRIIMRSGQEGTPAVVYEGRIAMDGDRPIGLIVSDGNGGPQRVVDARELATVATQVAEGTYNYPSETAAQPEIQPPVHEDDGQPVPEALPTNVDDPTLAANVDDPTRAANAGNGDGGARADATDNTATGTGAVRTESDQVARDQAPEVVEPVLTMVQRQQQAVFEAVRDVSRKLGKGQYEAVRAENLRKVPKVDGQYVNEQLIKHWLKQWVREGLLEMKGSGYVPTTKFDALVREQAAAQRAAREAQTGDGSGN